MHNGWHNADNGGGNNDLYLGEPDGTFTKLTNKHTGINETRWSLAAATADFNVDGKTDVYIANDFGQTTFISTETMVVLRASRVVSLVISDVIPTRV